MILIVMNTIGILPIICLFDVARLKLSELFSKKSSNAAAWFATTAMRLHRLWCPFGEVQQDLLLSSLTIG